MDMDNYLYHWLRVWYTPGIHWKHFKKLIATIGNIDQLEQLSQLDYEKLGFSTQTIQALKNPHKKQIEEALIWNQNPQCHILIFEDSRYPFHLKHIATPPPILYIQGSLETLYTSQIALVGSRNPSAGGKETAFEFAYALAQQNLTIHSGLALGIDSASHQGALASKGLTIATLGTGMNHIYPKSNQILVQNILENQGTLISEFPLDTPPNRYNFPQRNRIISALSLGVLVIEAGLHSGSLITAHYAMEQGKEIFAIPSSIHNPLAKGCHYLIKEGAKLVENIQDILEELNLPFSQVHTCEKKFSQKPKLDLDADSSQLLSYMDYLPNSIELLMQRTGLDSGTLSSILLTLELKGYIIAVPEGYQKL